MLKIDNNKTHRMKTDKESILLEKHPNYRIMFLSTQALKEELQSSWSRQDLISWLKWNDPNGVYSDEESLDEIGNIMSFEEGVELVINRV